ncbi:MAG: zf-HC2 domain-containing protein [Thermoguttaceae bacterium]
MTDPSDELLSAYLDGELTAAERARVERLLATDPAARQTLDDLRAVSAAMQSLPREKVGEDLTQPVLQAAERRMLAEGRPDEPAVPLARELFQRFLSRRTLAWLSVTAVMVIAISIYDRQTRLQRVMPGGDRPDAARLLARSPAQDEPPALESGAASPSAARPMPGSPEPQAAKPSKARFSVMDRDATEMKPAEENGPDRRLAKQAPLAEKVESKHKESNNAVSAPTLLVVRCDIASTALQDKSFDKLLDANRLIGRRQPAPSTPALVSSPEPRAARARQRGESASPAARVADRVYTEPTPSQLKALLAAMAARPELFSTVSTEPISGRLAESIIRQYMSEDQARPRPGDEATASYVATSGRQQVLFVFRIASEQPPAATKRQKP